MTEPRPDRLRAVCFDIDGTLYASRPFRRVYVRQNLLYLRTITTARKVRESLRGLAFEDGAAFFAEQHRLVGERLGRPADKVAEQVTHLFGPRVCAALERTGPRPEARAAIERLVDAGLKIAVFSDFGVPDKLAALGLDDLPWGAQLASEAQGALKPHPRGFLAVAEALGVAPAQMVHVGDREDTDGAGARAAGMGFRLVSEAAGQRFDEVVGGLLA